MTKTTKDFYGRIWPYPKNELCSVCGQPDNCGDCSHKRLSDKVVKMMLSGDENAKDD